jgi:hypothetical protein
MTGGALGGDWNADGALAPADAHWPVRTPTWILVKATPPAAPAGGGGCAGFLTLLQPRNGSAGAARVARVD